MSDPTDDVGVIFSPGPGWTRPSRALRILHRIDTTVTCNWFAIALWCRIKGHDWRTERPTRCVEIMACRHCGKFRGSRRISDDTRCWWYRPEDD